MEEFSDIVGQNLKKYRLEKRLSQLELMDLSGVSQATIAAAENGRPIMLGNLVRIALALEVPLERFIPESYLIQDPSTRLIAISDISKDEIEAIKTILDSNTLPLLEILIPLKNLTDNPTEEKKQALKKIVNSLLDNDECKANTAL